MGILLMISCLQEDYKKEEFIQTTEALSCCKKTFIYAMKPLSLLYAFLWFFIWHTDVNCVKPKEVMLHSHKNNAVCKPFDIELLKRIGKRNNNSTINDVVLSLVSVSMRDYMRSHDDLSSKTINILVPFSLREIPKTRKDLVLENDFSCLCFTLKLCAEFKEAIDSVKKTTMALKKSIYPFGVNALTQLIAWFPGIVGQLIMMWVCSKATIVMSNVPGPKNGINFHNGL